MNGPIASTTQAVQRLAQRLQLPETTTKVQFTFQAGLVPTITITRLLTPHEIEELTTWYVVEGLSQRPQKEVTYGLEPREPAAQPVITGPACDPVAQEGRQMSIDGQYRADGRDDPSHPHHGTYTGLAAAAQG